MNPQLGFAAGFGQFCLHSLQQGWGHNYEMTITLPNYPVPAAISRDHQAVEKLAEHRLRAAIGKGQSSFTND
jgi:hypothetical protein